ncbi:hypothetical protein GA0115250_105215 [Streptomyces sp. BvitLS-983]|nr:hypothetical protein Salbus254_1904 [Streptomyces albidoflavus]CAI4173655.1 hypothetical protein CCOS2040_21785 [Streptomyces albidoflavus]SCD38492.1 hypothetical protein GA0115250_105215 [Streptomyces sp. BvitLS-983]SCD65883.1 hypothetical protein GA0115236_11604 [Streptomyces sp. IgraMP-1]
MPKHRNGARLMSRTTRSPAPRPEDRRREKHLRFEIMRLDDVDGAALESTVVDADSVNRIVQQAAAIGQRLYIRPADTSAS